MLIQKIAVENVRSFLERQEMLIDGPISIIVGPNGGGKTNLLDAIVLMLRKYLLATRYVELFNQGDGIERWQYQENPALNNMLLEPHKNGSDHDQLIEITIRVSQSDLENMKLIQNDTPEIQAKDKRIYIGAGPWDSVANWQIENIAEGADFTYVLKNRNMQPAPNKPAADFLEYLKLFEHATATRAELGKEALRLPMIYLPVHRAAGGFQSRVQLANFNDKEQKRQLDSVSSRTGGTNIVNLAIGRLGRKFRRLQENQNVNARATFYDDENLKKLTEELESLGYSWKLETINTDTNEYDVALTKQDTEFSVSAASSGERELLTYLFAIYALNVRDAVIVIDEPELHLHPRWQKILFRLFEKLAAETGNQFVMATHSPTFISPSSIQYVTRVYIEDQRSRIVRLDSQDLPNRKHLFNLVNSQNNERIFFSDHILLVEGLTDRIFFEKMLAGRPTPISAEAVEVVSVSGKGLFPAYQKLLDACRVPYSIIADLDYVEQMGTADIKSFFSLDSAELKIDVIDNVKSLDGAALVARIDEAIASGNWDDARDIWAYIKSRRIALSSDLDENEKINLHTFIDELKSSGLHILKLGALESYLPEGLRSKDVEKLVQFLEQDNFRDLLPAEGRKELDEIIATLPPIPDAKDDALTRPTAALA